MTLTTGGGQVETYKRTKNIRSHTYSESIVLNETGKIIELKDDINIDKVILLLDSLFRLQSYIFIPTFRVKDSILTHKFWNQNTKLTEKQIENYFNKNDTLQFMIKDIGNYKDSFKQLTVRRNGAEAIDGAPYKFKLTINYDNGDNSHYLFDGNLYGSPNLDNYKNWLSLYLTFQKFPFFEMSNIEEYLSPHNLELITRGFIEWTTND